MVPPATLPSRAPMSSAPTGASGPPRTAPPLPIRLVRARLGQVARAAPPMPVCEASAAPENPPAKAPEIVRLLLGVSLSSSDPNLDDFYSLSVI